MGDVTHSRQDLTMVWQKQRVVYIIINVQDVETTVEMATEDDQLFCSNCVFSAAMLTGQLLGLQGSGEVVP